VLVIGPSATAAATPGQNWAAPWLAWSKATPLAWVADDEELSHLMNSVLELAET